MSRLRNLLVLLALGLLGVSLQADQSRLRVTPTVSPIKYPGTCDLSDLTTYTANTASDGDTIQLPPCTQNSGEETWTINKCVIVMGDSTATTIIQDTRALDTHQFLVQYNVPASCTTARITAMQFKWTTADSPFDDNYYIQMAGTNDSRRIRVDNNIFTCNGDTTNPGAKSAAVFVAESVYGVFDHNTVTGCQTAFLGYVKGSAYVTGVDNDGNEAWAAADSFGTDQFFFIETNTLTLASTTYHVTMLDAQAGGRFVFRYNAVTQGSLEGHGLEATSERSTRAVEVYNNTFTGDPLIGSQLVVYSRGGVYLVHDNGVYGYGATPNLSVLNNRSTSALAAPFGGMDGRNPWDVNDAGNPFETGTCDTVGTLTCTDAGRSLADWSGYQLRATSGNSCGGGGTAALTQSGGTVTVTCNAHGYPAPNAISSLTSSGTTATATVGTHSLQVGQGVSISGADQAAYNGSFRVSAIAATTFSYVMGSDPVDTATGTLNLALAIGVWGADQTPYNGTFTIINVTANTFQYLISFAPVSPATGTIRVRMGNYFSEIVSNTSTELTFKDSIYDSGSFGFRFTLDFVAGDTWEINKVTYAMDMIGRRNGSILLDSSGVVPVGWNDQNTSPWYEWNNLNCPSAPPTVGCASGTDIDFNIVNAVIVLGRDVIEDTAKPGYTPYTYPNPLVTP